MAGTRGTRDDTAFYIERVRRHARLRRDYLRSDRFGTLGVIFAGSLVTALGVWLLSYLG